MLSRSPVETGRAARSDLARVFISPLQLSAANPALREEFRVRAERRAQRPQDGWVLRPARRCLLELAFGLEHLREGWPSVSAQESSSLGHPATVGARRRSSARKTHAVPPVAGLPELDVARVQRWCTDRVPEHARHQVRVECEVDRSYLTVVERRAPWRADFGPDWTRLPIARLRYTKASKTWTLYWQDRNLRFHRYDRSEPSVNVYVLIDEIDCDPTGIFWG
jgi:hypothetical protein